VIKLHIKKINQTLMISIFIITLLIIGCKNREVRDISAIVEEGKQEVQNITGSIAKISQSQKDKILFIVAPQDFRDDELFTTKEILQQDYDVIIASRDVEIAQGMLGARVKVDLDIRDVNVDDYIAIVFIGGSGTTVYFDDQTALNIAKQAYQKNKTIGAICLAPAILANAGILNGKKATSFKSARDILKKHGAIVLDQPVVIDNNIITASGPDAAYDFGNALLKAIKSSKS